MSKLKPTWILCSVKSVSSMKICNCILQLSKARLGRSHSSEQTSNTVDAVVARPSRHSCCSSNCCSHFLGLIGCVHTHTQTWGRGVMAWTGFRTATQVSGVLNSLVVSIQEFKPYGKVYDSLTFPRFSLTTGMCPWYELTATLRQKVASKMNFTEFPYI